MAASPQIASFRAGRSPVRRTWPRHLPSFLCACALLAGCGGGGGSALRPLAEAIPEVGSLAPPPDRQPETSEQPVQTPPPASTECITLHDGTCVSTPDFNDRAAQLAQGYADHSTFTAPVGSGKHRRGAGLCPRQPARGRGHGAGRGRDHRLHRHGHRHGPPDIRGKDDYGSVHGRRRGRDGRGAVILTARPWRASRRESGIRLLRRIGAQGVAWGADIAMFAIPLGQGGTASTDPFLRRPARTLTPGRRETSTRRFRGGTAGGAWKS